MALATALAPGYTLACEAPPAYQSIVVADVLRGLPVRCAIAWALLAPAPAAAAAGNEAARRRLVGRCTVVGEAVVAVDVIAADAPVKALEDCATAVLVLVRVEVASPPLAAVGPSGDAPCAAAATAAAAATCDMSHPGCPQAPGDHAATSHTRTPILHCIATTTACSKSGTTLLPLLLQCS